MRSWPADGTIAFCRGGTQVVADTAQGEAHVRLQEVWQMKENADNKKLSLDVSLTACIAQLAARAKELHEVDTATVLYALAAHRLVLADSVMAILANAQVLMLQSHLDEIVKKPEDKA